MGKHLLKLSIFKKRSLGRSESFEERLFKILENLSVVSSVFFELRKLFFKRLLFLGDESSKKLLFQTSLGDSEIDNCCLSSQLRREVRVGKS